MNALNPYRRLMARFLKYIPSDERVVKRFVQLVYENPTRARKILVDMPCLEREALCWFLGIRLYSFEYLTRAERTRAYLLGGGQDLAVPDPLEINEENALTPKQITKKMFGYREEGVFMLLRRAAIRLEWQL